MATLSTIHTLVPNASIPLGYFDEDNIVFIQRKIKDVLKREFKQDILFDRASVIRLMERALLERVDTIPYLNQRVIMYATNEYRVYQLDIDKHLKWEAHFTLSQRLYDPSVEIIKYDPQTVYPPNRLGNTKVGGTTRFYFT
jgi:hypothetical protein